MTWMFQDRNLVMGVMLFIFMVLVIRYIQAHTTIIDSNTKYVYPKNSYIKIRNPRNKDEVYAVKIGTNYVSSLINLNSVYNHTDKNISDMLLESYGYDKRVYDIVFDHSVESFAVLSTQDTILLVSYLTTIKYE